MLPAHLDTLDLGRGPCSGPARGHPFLLPGDLDEVRIWYGSPQSAAEIRDSRATELTSAPDRQDSGPYFAHLFFRLDESGDDKTLANLERRLSPRINRPGTAAFSESAVPPRRTQRARDDSAVDHARCILNDWPLSDGGSSGRCRYRHAALARRSSRNSGRNASPASNGEAGGTLLPARAAHRAGCDRHTLPSATTGVVHSWTTALYVAGASSVMLLRWV